MRSAPARTAMVIIGVLALILGGVWIGQGAGLIPGSFMTGSSQWLIIGLVLAVIGVVLLVLGIRRPTRPSAGA